MDIRQLRSFAAVARLRHFTHAAEELHLAQPALSQQIRQLERELGVRLLDRSSRRVALTEAGKALYIHAQGLLADLDRAEYAMAAFAGLRRGRVSIGTLQTVAEGTLPPLIARFHQRYPGLEIHLIEEMTDQLTAMVLGGLLDIAFIHTAEHEGQPGVEFPPVQHPDLICTPLYRERLMVTLAPAHRLAAMPSVPFAALRGEPLIVFKAGASLRLLVAAACAYHGFAPQISCEVSGATSARALAAEGLGAAILPRSAAEGQGPHVAARPIHAPAMTRTVMLVRHRGRDLSPATEVFLETVRDVYPTDGGLG
ncbi:LysR family transcriptional regulator [Chloroflexia bacterium SDU3-3]|nr:LysR family transcriptional regulator [Chloroflexia bacterium SDU3-3]